MRLLLLLAGAGLGLYAGMQYYNRMIKEDFVVTVPVIKRSDWGENVEKLQTALNHLGYGAGYPDGIFGSMTEDALRRFQLDAGIAVDGVAGMDTYGALNDALIQRGRGTFRYEPEN